MKPLAMALNFIRKRSDAIYGRLPKRAGNHPSLPHPRPTPLPLKNKMVHP